MSSVLHSSPDTQVVFRRINGRIVPVKVKRTGPHYANEKAIKESVAIGAASTTTVYAAAQAYRYRAFKQGFRLSGIVNKLRTYGPQVARTKSVQMDMFEAAFHAKAAKRAAHWAARANKLSKSRDFYMKAASMIGRHGKKVAVGFGIAAGVSAYLSHVAVEDKRRR